jgi:hypothetical protein
VANGGGHFANLAVFSLGELQTDPAVWDALAITDGWIPWRELGLRIQKPGPAGKGFSVFD